MLCQQCRYVNNFDETFVYECTTGAGVITGATKVTIISNGEGVNYEDKENTQWRKITQMQTM